MTKKERNIKLFKKAVHHWINHFALQSFQFVIESRITDSALASCHFWEMREEGGGERVFTICYAEKWIVKATPEEISLVAFHEVMEALIYKIYHFGENKTLIISQREVNDAAHAIIRTFENCVFKYLPKE